MKEVSVMNEQTHRNQITETNGETYSGFFCVCFVLFCFVLFGRGGGVRRG